MELSRICIIKRNQKWNVMKTQTQMYWAKTNQPTCSFFHPAEMFVRFLIQTTRMSGRTRWSAKKVEWKRKKKTNMSSGLPLVKHNTSLVCFFFSLFFSGFFVDLVFQTLIYVRPVKTDAIHFHFLLMAAIQLDVYVYEVLVEMLHILRCFRSVKSGKRLNGTGMYAHCSSEQHRQIRVICKMYHLI